MTSITGKVSMHVGRKFNRKHNTRDFDVKKWNKDGHIDPDRSSLNVTIIDKDLKEVFDEKFSNALMEFDKKNEVKHPDRVIGMSRLQYEKLVEQVGEEKANEIRRETTVNAYYSQQKNKANEVIIQLSDSDNFEKMKAEVGEEKAYEIHKEFLKNACQKFIEDNPNFEVFGAYIHCDESVPHLHLDFLPIEENSKRGLSAKVNLDGALKKCKLVEGGIRRGSQKTYDSRPYVQWLHAQRADIEQQAGKYIVVKPSEPSSKERLETYEYRSLIKAKDEVNSVLGAFSRKGIFNAKERNTAAQAIIDNAALITDTMTADIRKEQKNIQTAKERYEWRNEELDRREKALSAQETALKTQQEIIKIQAKALQQKEQNVQTVIDKAVQQRVEQEINRIDGEIHQKRSKLNAMDDEISSKGKILTEMNVSLWTSQSFMRQSELNMKRANDLIKEWSERNASENDRPTIPQR